MRIAVVSLMLGLWVGCGAGDKNPIGDSDANAPMCTASISFLPAEAVAAPDTVIRAEAVVDATGVPSYQWFVFRGSAMVPFDLAATNDVITFSGATAGTYDVFLRVSVPDTFCPEAHVQIEVREPGAGQSPFRIHAIAPANATNPAVSSTVIVDGGSTDTLPDLVMPKGTLVEGNLVANSQPVAAYLRFMPATGRDAAVETYCGVAGQYSVMLRSESHDVLVIPFSSALAPRIVTWRPGMTSLAVDSGDSITGTVRNSAGAPIGGAAVTMTIAGVPATIGATDANGRFSIQGLVVAGAEVVVEVTPPASTGLPRLTLSSTSLDLTADVAVQYAALTVRDVATTLVQRGTTALGGATVSIIGEALANVGTIGGIAAIGDLHVVVTAGGNGRLPTQLAPARALTAVVEAGPGDYAVAAFDLTAGVPATIASPSMIASTTTIIAPGGGGLAGATLDLVPRSALARAGAPTVRLIANGAGTVNPRLANRADYDLRFSDPAGRGGQRVVAIDNVTSGLPASHALLPATLVTVKVTDGVNSLAGALVQFRCVGCAGVDRARAIAEGATGIDGTITLAVPRP